MINLSSLSSGYFLLESSLSQSLDCTGLQS